MENSVKAIYMAGGMFIAVMVFTSFVYMFRNAARVGESYDLKKSTEQVQAFNAQFEIYETGKSVQDSNTGGYAFLYSKGNTASDVISCANLAFDINKKNDYDLQNSIKVIVDMKSSGKFYIYPSKNQEENKFVKNISFSAVENGSIHESNYYDFYDFLENYNNARIVNIISPRYNSTNEVMYEYYFDVLEDGIKYSEITGKVEEITFVLYNTEGWGASTCWIDV